MIVKLSHAGKNIHWFMINIFIFNIEYILAVQESLIFAVLLQGISTCKDKLANIRNTRGRSIIFERVG